MTSAAKISYEEWKLELPSMPPRSTLYSLKPIGMGTPLVECLTSYISRLAEAHCVFPGILMRKLISPFLQQSSVYQESWQSMEVGKTEFTQSFNGTAQKQAAAAVYALEHLTLQHSLRFLTLLTWGGVFPAFKLLRQKRAWCPSCLEEWRSTGQVIYEPLLWTFQVVTLCTRHQCELCVTCPHEKCGKSAPWLAWRSRPGYCSHCGQWLGATLHFEVEMDEATMSWQQWVTGQLGTLLALAPTLATPPPRNRIHELLRHALQQMGPERHGRHSNFARSIGVARPTYSTWISRQELPHLETLLSLCALWRISLYECLFTDVAALSLHPEEGQPEPPKHQRQTKVRDSPNTAQVRDALEAILTSDEFPPPTLKAVAQRLGCSKSRLRRCHRELCNAITERYRTSVQAKQQADLQRYCAEVRQTALRLAAQGQRPTRRKLAEMLKKPGILRSPEIREAWQEVLREFDGNTLEIAQQKEDESWD